MVTYLVCMVILILCTKMGIADVSDEDGSDWTFRTQTVRMQTVRTQSGKQCGDEWIMFRHRSSQRMPVISDLGEFGQVNSDLGDLGPR